MLGRMRLAEIEGAEDIHWAAMWDAFGHCPAGGAGDAPGTRWWCRGAGL